MTRKFTVTVALVVLLAATILVALSARNEYCFPWQQRVGYGDGPFGPGQDVSFCR